MQIVTTEVEYARDASIRGWICCAHYHSRVDYQVFVLVGSGETAEGARADLMRLLRDRGVTGHVEVSECTDPLVRDGLLLAAKKWAAAGAAPFEVVAGA